MLAPITATLTLGFAVVLAIVALLGWGNLVWRALGFERPARPDTGSAWLGYCVVSGVVEGLHLFLPIDWKVTLLVGVIGLVGCIIGGFGTIGLRRLGSRAVSLAARYPWQSGLLAMLVLAWCLRAMAVPNNYDSGLYHFQSIRWLNEEPIVFGIGNLHWRLALNQSYFGFLALLNLAPFWNKGYAAGGIVLLALTLATLIETGLGQSVRWRLIFGAGLLVFLGFVAGSSVNPTPDNAVALMEVATLLFLFRVLQRSAVLSTDVWRSVIVALFLCVVLVATKFSSAAFASGSVAILAVHLLRTRAIRHVLIFRAVPLAALLGAAHVARGFILSGSPFFPATWLGGWQLEWSVPIEVAQMETAYIRSWARMPGADLSASPLQGSAWIPAWFARQSGGTVTLMVTGFLLMLVVMVRCLQGRQDSESRAIGVLYVPLIFGLAFWFLTAPDVRFLGAVLVLFVLLSAYLAFARAEVPGSWHWCDRFLSMRSMSVIFFALAWLGSTSFVGLRSLSFEGWRELPKPATIEKRTDSGALVRVPESGNQCWDAPLPCASLFNPHLRRGSILSHSMFTVKPD